jgi:hypothetical protein
MSTRNLPAGKGRLVRKFNNVVASAKPYGPPWPHIERAVSFPFNHRSPLSSDVLFPVISLWLLCNRRNFSASFTSSRKYIIKRFGYLCFYTVFYVFFFTSTLLCLMQWATNISSNHIFNHFNWVPYYWSRRPTWYHCLLSSLRFDFLQFQNPYYVTFNGRAIRTI